MRYFTLTQNSVPISHLQHIELGLITFQVLCGHMWILDGTYWILDGRVLDPLCLLR